MTSTTNSLKISSEEYCQQIGVDDLLAQISDEWQELVRQHCEKSWCSSPLHQARAAKNPNYWKELSPGLWNLPDMDWEDYLAKRMKELQAQQ